MALQRRKVSFAKQFQGDGAIVVKPVLGKQQKAPQLAALSRVVCFTCFVIFLQGDNVFQCSIPCFIAHAAVGCDARHVNHAQLPSALDDANKRVDKRPYP